MITLDYFGMKYGDRVQIKGYGRMELAKDFNNLGFTKGVEIGTEKGKYAMILCEANPNLHLWCVDPWICYDENKGYKDVQGQDIHNSNLKKAQRRLKKYNCTLVQKFSMDAVKDFEDESLDFVYIDGNHRLEYVISDLVEWTKKVKVGGVVAGHDYIKFKSQHYSHVPYALNAYFRSYPVEKWYLLDQKSENFTKEENNYLDRIRSWFFIK